MAKKAAKKKAPAKKKATRKLEPKVSNVIKIMKWFGLR